ncbi:MAG: hypothetical protein ACI9YL_001188 [Luteibaculaceae bacterium]|jgi:hypothetical protein
MKFWYRLRVYLVGVGIGIVLVFFFFKDRTSVLTSWTPNNRIMLELVEKKVMDNPAWKCFNFCLEVDDVNAFYSTGDVRFSESQTKINPRVYKVLFSKSDNHHVEMEFVMRDSTVDLTAMKALDFQVECDCL